MSGITKLKKKIEMKTILEDEIKEQMEKLGEKAKEILIKNDEIFNSGSITPQILQKEIDIRVNSDVDFEILNELQRELNPNKIILSGGGYQGMFSGQSAHGFVDIKLIFGD